MSQVASTGTRIPFRIMSKCSFAVTTAIAIRFHIPNSYIFDRFVHLSPSLKCIPFTIRALIRSNLCPPLDIRQFQYHNRRDEILGYWLRSPISYKKLISLTVFKPKAFVSFTASCFNTISFLSFTWKHGKIMIGHSLLNQPVATYSPKSRGGRDIKYL